MPASLRYPCVYLHRLWVVITGAPVRFVPGAAWFEYRMGAPLLVQIGSLSRSMLVGPVVFPRRLV